MAPPPLPTRHYGPTITSRQVTEDTPPDLLEGTMDLQVTLPSGKSIIMNVHRSTPMMDLLVQVTTAHRINPGGHIIQVVSDNIFLSYKPSTPIGQLDTSAIKIVPKNKLKDAVKNRKSNLQQQAIERNIRLKVNLPRNQLAVYRVPPRTLISDILSMVCKDKNLDQEAFEIRHPVNVDERLRGSCALSDYQLQEVCVVSRDFRPPPLSVTDLITMASIAHPDDKKRRGFLGGIFSRKAKSSTGDSSVSSGSAGERSVSPARSDESMDGRPAPRALSPAAATSATLPNNTSRIRTNVAGGNSSARLSRPVSMISLSKTKKGPAPVPPLKKSVSNINGNVQPIKESKVSLSRHSSDSSGYHEPETKSSHASPSNSVIGTLEATSKSTPSKSNLPHVSSQSMSSIALSKCKRRAPPPPPTMANKTPPLAIPEEDVDNSRNISNLSMASTECSNSVETLKNYPAASIEMLNFSESSVDPPDASNKEETDVISDIIKDSSTDNSPTNSKVNTLKMSKDSNSGTANAENAHRCDDSKISSLNNSEGSCSKSLSDSHTSSETVTDSPFEEVIKDLSSEKINDRCSDIVVFSAVELSNGISPEPSNNASLENVQSDTNRASPYSTSIPTPDTFATIETSAIVLPVNSPNTSVESPKVDFEEDPSVGIDSNSRQLPCSTSDNEVQTQKLNLSSETSHEYVELLNDLQRPKRQKKHRAKIPEDFAECSGDGRIYKSAEETEKPLTSECEPLTHDLPVTDCSATFCDTSEPTMADTEDTYSGNMLSKTVLNGPSDNPPPLFSSSSDDFQDILNKKNSELALTIDSDEEDSFDVNGIIEVALLLDDTINIQSENVPDNIQSNAVNILPEFIDEKLNVSEAFNLDVHKQIQTKDENFSIDDLCAGMYVEFPKQEESSTDPSTQTLERRRNNFTSKVELSSENDERLGLVKTPVQRSISITQISASSEERKIKEEYVKNDVNSELKSNIEVASSNHSPKILTLKPKSTSDYKVVLSYNNSSSQPASLVDKRMERTDSNSSYESLSSVSNAQIKSDILVKCDRSSTETSYESAPPPLPESHVPMSSDSESKESRSSSVSSQSSLSECDKSDFKKPQRQSGPPQPVFSISTYASRAEKISYDKKLVRSESLMSIDDIHNKKPTCVSEDSNPSNTKDDFLNRRLGRTDSKRNDLFRSEEALNKNFILHRIMPESSKPPVLSVNCEKSGTNSPTVPVMSLASELDNSDHHHVQDTFRSRRSAFEQKPSPSSRRPEPIKFELGSAKDSITFSNRVVRNPTTFYLRRAKSTLDICGAGPAADNKYGDGVAYPSGGEPALAQEYMKLQDDFMKWQQQLLQNQHVLHSKVAPIASNPPTLNNFGMTKEMGPPISQGPPQPKKPVEITIPIRFEDTGEIVGSTNETHIISRSSQENQMPTQQYSNARPAYSQFSNHSWNNPGMNIGTWEQRPAEREKEPSPSNQQSNFVNSGSRPFNRTQFVPANSGPTSGMQTVFQSTPAQLHDNRFRYQEYPEQQSAFQGAPEPPGRFQEMSQPRYQNSFQPKFQAAPDPQMRFQEAQQPRFNKEISPPRFQELPPSRYQEAPQTRYHPAPQNVTESTPQYSTRPQDFSTQNRPQMPYINGPAYSNSNNQASDKNDDNINARFTSVVTLSNDKTGDNAPKKDKVRSIVQLNNVDSEPLQGSSMFRGGPVVKGFQVKTEPQILNNEREKRSPPICSVTPMSSRLVQQAVQQPEAANSGGFRISPPRFERKSPSPPKVEQSPPPFSNVTLRHVEPRVSPPRASPLRISPPREPSPATSAPQQAISPPPAPPMNIPPPPPPSSGIPPPPPLREGSEERRTSAGKRIMSANNVPQLDAREELMMAIRQFGGSSGKLRRSPNPFN